MWLTESELSNMFGKLPVTNKLLRKVAEKNLRCKTSLVIAVFESSDFEE